MRLTTRLKNLWDDLTTPRPDLKGQAKAIDASLEKVSADLEKIDKLLDEERKQHQEKMAGMMSQLMAVQHEKMELSKQVRTQIEADLVLVSLKIIHEALTRGVVDHGLARQQAMLQQQLVQMPAALGIGPLAMLGDALGSPSLGGGLPSGG